MRTKQTVKEREKISKKRTSLATNDLVCGVYGWSEDEKGKNQHAKLGLQRDGMGGGDGFVELCRGKALEEIQLKKWGGRSKKYTSISLKNGRKAGASTKPGK